jgi:hypothetical protein
MLKTTISPIDHVTINHQNHNEQMAFYGHVLYKLRLQFGAVGVGFLLYFGPRIGGGGDVED